MHHKYGEYWIWSFNITVFKGTLSVFTTFVALFMIEILPRVLNMDHKWTKLAFVQKYLCFIILRRDLNIFSWETDEKLTRLCWSSMDVLPSESSSRSHDWKLWIEGGLKSLTVSSFSSRSLLSWFFSSLLAFRISRSCSLSSVTEARLLCMSSRSVFSRSLWLFSDSRRSLSTHAVWSCSRTWTSWESWEDCRDIKISQYNNSVIWSPRYDIHCDI